MFSPSEESKAVIDDAASQLGVEPSELSDALKQALKNRVDEARRRRPSHPGAGRRAEGANRRGRLPAALRPRRPRRAGRVRSSRALRDSRDRGLVPRNDRGGVARRAPGQDARRDREGAGQDRRGSRPASRRDAGEADRRGRRGRASSAKSRRPDSRRISRSAWKRSSTASFADAATRRHPRFWPGSGSPRAPPPIGGPPA